MSRSNPTQRGTSPSMSVILVTDGYPRIRRVMDRLRAQTAREDLEIVLVVPHGVSMELEQSPLADFAAIRLVRVESILPLASARAAGVRAATAPVVALGETHAFPQAEWAEALIRAHEQPWAVVVPAFCNANPESSLSWANFLRDYGLWMDGLPAREIDFLPPYNTATKRSVLLSSQGDLESLVSRADELAARLQAGGHRCYFEPAAKIDHANVSRPGAWVAQRFLVGRSQASGRAERWSRARLLLYACATPLIPVAILSKLGNPVRLMQRRRQLTGGTMLALLFGAITSAAGEMVTYLFGASPAAQLRCDEYELYKLRYTSLSDQ